MTRVFLVVIVAWGAFIACWGPSVLTLTVDDSFYYLVTARNAAHGFGFSFDQLHTTNGFHPLWMWLLVPLARVFGHDMDTFVRVILALQSSLVVASTYALLRGVSAQPRWRTAALVLALLSGFYFVKVLVNGLESALFYALLVALLRLVMRIDDPARPRRDRELVILAAVASALCLARITAVVFAVPALIVASRRFKGRPGLATASAAAYVLPLVGYALSNRLQFGHWVPVSAAIKANRDGGPLSDRLLALGLSIVPLVLVTLILGAPWDRGIRRPLRLAIALLAAGSLAQGFVDGAVRGLLVPEIWTLVPQATLLVLLLARDPPILAKPFAWGGALALLVAFDAASWAMRFRPASYVPYVEARRAGTWLSEHSSQDAIAAGWDCGITAAFSSRRFINLDGLINSWTYKETVLDRGGEDQYLNENRVDYVVQPFDVVSLPELENVALRGGDLETRDSPWSQWPVVYAKCFEFQPILSRPRRQMVELIFERNGSGPLLTTLLHGLCYDLPK